MTLIIICIGCNKPISPSTQPVFKDNNGDLVYHPKCLTTQAKMVTNSGAEFVPVDICVGWIRDVGGICFIDVQAIHFPSSHVTHLIKGSSPVRLFYDKLSEWRAITNHTNIVELERRNMNRYYSQNTIDIVYNITKVWCDANNCILRDG